MQIRNRVKALRNVRAGDLVPNPKNWRAHPKAQQDALRGILAEVGYADALLARELDDGRLMLVDGHLRAETTPEQEVPVLVLDLNEAEADKLLLSLDPLAALAETNAVALDALLREVDTGSEGLQQMYADLAEAAELYQDDAKEIVEDEVPEPPADPITKPGDLWLLGDHRLLCGDSTKAEDVERLMAGAKADALISDPPYGMNYTGCTTEEVRPGMMRRDVTPIVNDDRPFDASVVLSTFPADEQWLWGADWYYATLPSGGSVIVWDKRISPAADSTPGAPFEVLWSRRRRAREFIRHPWGGWFSKERGDKDRHHPTQKPIACMAYPIERGAEKGGLIVDPYMGSGTTLIAADQLGRKCYGMEISPAYCDVIVKRWETLTGKKAQLEVNDGKARPATGANHHQDGEGQPRQKAAQQKRAKAGR